jgi:outer membrane biosynthesis protein TonB
LVTTSVGNRSWHTVWESEHELPLDYPAVWSLSETEGGLQLRRPPTADEDGPATLDVPFEETRQGVEFTLPPTAIRRGMRQVRVRILRVPPIPPAYRPMPAKRGRTTQFRQTDLYVYSGCRDFLLACRCVRRLYGCLLDNRRIFAFYKSGDGYKIKAYREDVVLETANGEVETIPVGVPEYLDHTTMEQGTIRWRDYWWRVNEVDRPEELPGILFEDDDIPESLWFKRVGKSLGLGLIVMTILVQIVGRSFFQTKKVLPQEVVLKQPKIIPLQVAKLRPTPAPKVAEKKPKPKKEAAPPKRVAAKPKPPKPQPPPRLAKAQPKPQPRAPAPRRPSPPVAKSAPPPPNPAVQQQAQLAKSLSFLSPSKNRPAAIASDASAAKYKDSAATDVKDLKSKSSLRGISGSRDTGDVALRDSRDIKADGGISGSQRGKGLNEVQGKVSLNALYDPNAGADMGSAMGSGKGMQLSGPGSVSDSLIEKTLAKYLSKFQYCYEKALLNDASLAGTVVVQWTIESSGAASDVKIVRSQIPNKGMQNCLAREIGKINFPHPSGGSVTIKYPFAFSSSSL